MEISRVNFIHLSTPNQEQVFATTALIILQIRIYLFICNRLVLIITIKLHLCGDVIFS